MDNFLALDLGTKTGFCVFSPDQKVSASGTKNFSQAASSHIGRRFACFRDWLIAIIHKYNIRGVFYEQVYAHTGLQASHVYGGFLYHLAAVCDDYNIPIKGLGVCTIKKNMTAKGHATKKQMIDEAFRRGFNPFDDNEADAIAIMLTAIQRKIL